MLNLVAIQGRLTRDPELRQTPNGVAVSGFTLAVDRPYADKDGNRGTDFIDCVAWRGLGEFVAKYFSRGSMAIVTGSIQVRNWKDRDGNKRRSVEVVANNVSFGETKRSAADRQSRTGESITEDYVEPVMAEDPYYIPADEPFPF